MNWKESLNGALVRATGYHLSKPLTEAERVAARPQQRHADRRRASGERLVKQPTFILCTLRSGSTLLRVLLDSHSQIHAPHELHLRYIHARVNNKWALGSMREAGLDAKGLRYLLWDRILHRELETSGKSVYVNKTPNDVFIADKILECWPDARFIFLLRHPGAIARSRKNLRPGADPEANVKTILHYGEALESSRRQYDGITVRYEEVTADPAAQTRRICEYLGIEWEPGMLDYGTQDHGRFRAGLGDWADKIKTGQVQQADPPPALDDIHPALHELCRAWGYLPALPAGRPAPSSRVPLESSRQT